MVDSLRALLPDMLLVTAGDNQTGNPINDQFQEKGWPMIELMNTVGFDLSRWAITSSTWGLITLRNTPEMLVSISCAANLTPPEGMQLDIRPYKVITLAQRY